MHLYILTLLIKHFDDPGKPYKHDNSPVTEVLHPFSHGQNKALKLPFQV